MTVLGIFLIVALALIIISGVTSSVVALVLTYRMKARRRPFERKESDFLYNYKKVLAEIEEAEKALEKKKKGV